MSFYFFHIEKKENCTIYNSNNINHIDLAPTIQTFGPTKPSQNSQSLNLKSANIPENKQENTTTHPLTRKKTQF